MINYGSGREVYAFGEEKVVKIPKNENGSMQNQKEVEIYEKYKDSEFGRFLSPCEIIDHNGNPSVLMDKRITWTDEEIENGEMFFDISNLFAEYQEDESLLEKLLDVLVTKEGLVEDDLVNPCNWGETKDGSLALVDFGWTYHMARRFNPISI